MMQKSIRIITRPDFDGIVCAVVLKKALKSDLPIRWFEPNQIQTRTADIQDGDIIANLPYDDRCSMWFDHHVSNEPSTDLPGAFKIAPSAAGVVYEYYKSQGMLSNIFDELIFHTDMIDSADLTRDQVLYPENYPYILLSMTVKNQGDSDQDYWEHLVDLLGKSKIEQVMADSEVMERSRLVIEENKQFARFLQDHTKIHGHISVTDFRSFKTVPTGNRFLTYSIFPETTASIKIRYKNPDKKFILLSIGRSIFNPGLKVNIGKLLAGYGGGGHAGAGGCTLETLNAQQAIDDILAIMIKNNPVD